MIQHNNDYMINDMISWLPNLSTKVNCFTHSTSVNCGTTLPRLPVTSHIEDKSILILGLPLPFPHPESILISLSHVWKRNIVSQSNICMNKSLVYQFINMGSEIVDPFRLREKQFEKNYTSKAVHTTVIIIKCRSRFTIEHLFNKN